METGGKIMNTTITDLAAALKCSRQAIWQAIYKLRIDVDYLGNENAKRRSMVILNDDQVDLITANVKKGERK
jgi:hypothetical protein